LALAGGGESIEARAAVVLRGAPRRFEPTSFDEAMERGIERSLVDFQDAAGDLLDPLADPPAVHGLERDGFEDQEIEGPLEDVGIGLHGLSPRYSTRECKRSCRMSRREM